MVADDSSVEEIEKKEIVQICLGSNSTLKTRKALQTKERFCCGYLLGNAQEQKLHVYDLIELDLTLFANIDTTNPLSETIQAEFASIRASIPVGIDFVGVFITQPENGNLEVAEHLLNYLKLYDDIACAPSFAICLIKPSDLLWFICDSDANMRRMNDVIESDTDLSKLPLFRLRQDVFVNWLTNTGEDGLQLEIDKIASDQCSQNPGFLIETIKTVMFDDDHGQTLPDMTCRELVNEIKLTLGLKTWPGEKPLSNVIDIKVLSRISSEGNDVHDLTTDSSLDDALDTQVICNVPVLWSQSVPSESVTIKMCIDALVVASLDTPTSKLHQMFRDAILQHCDAVSLLLKVNKAKFMYSPYHFSPDGSSFPFTVFLPTTDFAGTEVQENTLMQYRQFLHNRFLLPNDRPLLRKNVSCFADRVLSGYHLVNPHVGLNTPVIEGGKVALVNGKYSYHHYMQDNFDDNVWGCAYRSLQTLASWFWYQGYTERKYPSHKEIQEALVAIGDKEKTFIDSKEWIGSVEVSFCLDYFYGITSKTLHVTTGADMAYKGRDIYQHFVEEGTPIMIGGGVYAHTIVGVIFNEHTGAIRFLIVDPHFTGHDQLKTVQGKGWVGWKGPDFWNQTAHYNMCMPQRPKII